MNNDNQNRNSQQTQQRPGGQQTPNQNQSGQKPTSTQQQSGQRQTQNR